MVNVFFPTQHLRTSRILPCPSSWFQSIGSQTVQQSIEWSATELWSESLTQLTYPGLENQMTRCATSLCSRDMSDIQFPWSGQECRRGWKDAWYSQSCSGILLRYTIFGGDSQTLVGSGPMQPVRWPRLWINNQKCTTDLKREVHVTLNGIRSQVNVAQCWLRLVEAGWAFQKFTFGKGIWRPWCMVEYVLLERFLLLRTIQIFSKL